MSYRRQPNWSLVMHELRKERLARSAAAREAVALDAFSPPAARYDRRAIMADAMAQARASTALG